MTATDLTEAAERAAFDRREEIHTRWLCFALGSLAGCLLTALITFLLS